MGILDKFDRDEIVRPTVTVSFDEPEHKRVTNAACALKAKGCKNRGDFCRTAILEALKEVENAMGGADKVDAAAAKADPEGTRHQRKTRNGAPKAAVPSVTTSARGKVSGQKSA